MVVFYCCVVLALNFPCSRLQYGTWWKGARVGNELHGYAEDMQAVRAFHLPGFLTGAGLKTLKTTFSGVWSNSVKSLHRTPSRVGVNLRNY